MSSDNPMPPHPRSPTTADSANPSRDNIQCNILSSSVTATKVSTYSTINGGGTQNPTHVRSPRRVRPLDLASISNDSSISTPNHHSLVVELSQASEQSSNTSATRSATTESHDVPPLQVPYPDLIPPGHTYKTTNLAHYMNEPATSTLITALGDHHTTSPFNTRRNLVRETLHNTNFHFPPTSPPHPLPSNDHDASGKHDDLSDTEMISCPSLAELWTVPPAKAGSHLGYIQQPSDSQVASIGSQFSKHDCIYPQANCSLVGSVASTTQRHGHKWNDVEKEEFVDVAPSSTSTTEEATGG